MSFAPGKRIFDDEDKSSTDSVYYTQQEQANETVVNQREILTKKHVVPTTNEQYNNQKDFENETSSQKNHLYEKEANYEQSKEQEMTKQMEGLSMDSPIVCEHHGCNKTFSSVQEYEHHFHAAHWNECSICSKVFPTMRFLELHIAEKHDSLFKELSKKKPSYECLVSGCREKFWNSSERKTHLQEVHRMPANFDLQPIGFRNTLHRKRSTPKQKTSKSKKKKHNIKPSPFQTASNMDTDETTPPINESQARNNDNRKNNVNGDHQEMQIDDEDNVLAKPRFTYSYRLPDNFSLGNSSNRTFRQNQQLKKSKQSKQSKQKR